MKIFITGTDTNIGKTLISSWLCLHTGYEYFKPIQSGNLSTDRQVVSDLSGTRTYPEAYIYKAPVSPHLAASLENETIDISKIQLPVSSNLLVEGAGGIMVPINQEILMVDLIKNLNLPVILVARSTLGTINHTLLSLEALKSRNIDVLGVIVNGEPNVSNCEAIEYYGNIKVLAQVPILQEVTKESLLNTPMGYELNKIFEK